MDKKVIPIFKTDGSLKGRSILTAAPASEIKRDKPVSVASIAKDYKLDPTVVVEDNPTNFIKLFENLRDAGSNLYFGLRMTVCADVEQKDADSLKTEHKIIVFLDNEEGWSDLCQLSSFASVQGFYYQPRIDLDNLSRLWSEHFSLVVPFYDSYLFHNLFNSRDLIPKFPVEPTYFIEDHSHIYDGPLTQAIEAKQLATQHVHSIHYFEREHMDPISIMKCVANKTKYDKPNLDGWFTDSFSWETYWERYVAQS